MRIASISNVNFKSNVKFIENYYEKPEDKIGMTDSLALKKGLKGLQKNGNDDTVKVFALDGYTDSAIGIKVEKEIDGQLYEGNSTIALFYKDLTPANVQDAYANALEQAETKQTPVQQSIFDTFM